MTYRSRRALALERLESRFLMAVDFGDAPAPYATTLAENGARHEAVGPQLGALRDMEADGAHSATANGDGADDDGVVFGQLAVGQLGGTATVTVANAPAGARLDAWVDFDGDGSWGGQGEQIANNRAVVNGANVITFDVPATAVAQNVIARFRLSTAGNLGTKGMAADGEVEDYAVAIGSATRTAGQVAGKRTVTTQADSAQSVFAADVDGDGDMDLLSASLMDDEVAWFENNGAQSFTTHVIDTTADGVRSVYAADVDGDGDVDILSAADGSGTAWYESNGSESFTKRAISSLAGAKNVLAADVDADGDLDVVAAHGNRIAWYENSAQTFTQRLLPPAALGVFGVAAADVDGDGDMDVLWSSFTENEVGWYENVNQDFTARPLTSTAMGARNIATADVDSDGDLDVLFASAGDNRIAWLENDGLQAFTVRNISTTAMLAWSVFPADVDADGDIDVLAASANDDTIGLYINNGSEVFTLRAITTTANAARSVIAADIDGDGDLDVASASSVDDTIAWYENRPAGDYESTVTVDGGDFIAWQRALGAGASPQGNGADGNADGTVNGADLAVWRTAFGTTSPTPTPPVIVTSAILTVNPGLTLPPAEVFQAPSAVVEAAGEEMSEPLCDAPLAAREAAFASLAPPSAVRSSLHALATHARQFQDAAAGASLVDSAFVDPWGQLAAF